MKPFKRERKFQPAGRTGFNSFVILTMDIVLGIIVIALAILGMSIGLLLKGRALQGSCGGQGGKIVIDGVEMTCPTCGGDTSKCESDQTSGAEV